MMTLKASRKCRPLRVVMTTSVFQTIAWSAAAGTPLPQDPPHGDASSAPVNQPKPADSSSTTATSASDQKMSASDEKLDGMLKEWKASGKDVDSKVDALKNLWKDLASDATVTPAMRKRVLEAIDGTDVASVDNWGRFRSELMAGVAVSQDDERFSKTTPYVRFVGDTAWASSSADPLQNRSMAFCPADLHSWIDVAFDVVPAKAEKTNASGGTDEFVAAKKSYTGVVGLDWRLLQLEPIHQHHLFMGLNARVGVQSIAESQDDAPAASKNAGDVDTVNYFYEGGIRVGEYMPRLPSGDKNSSTFRGDDQFNPRLMRYIDIGYARFEQLSGPKVFVDGMLRFRPDGSDVSYFIGTRAILGEGRDDVRVVAGIDFSISKLGSVITSLLPPILTGENTTSTGAAGDSHH